MKNRHSKSGHRKFSERQFQSAASPTRLSSGSTLSPSPVFGVTAFETAQRAGLKSIGESDAHFALHLSKLNCVLLVRCVISVFVAVWPSEVSALMRVLVTTLKGHAKSGSSCSTTLGMLGWRVTQCMQLGCQEAGTAHWQLPLRCSRSSGTHWPAGLGPKEPLAAFRRTDRSMQCQWLF